jgi:hypothetical protein
MREESMIDHDYSGKSLIAGLMIANESDRLILQEARFTTLGDLAACTRSKIEELIGERGVNAVGSDLHAHNLDFKPEE